MARQEECDNYPIIIAPLKSIKKRCERKKAELFTITFDPFCFSFYPSKDAAGTHRGAAALRIPYVIDWANCFDILIRLLADMLYVVPPEASLTLPLNLFIEKLITIHPPGSPSSSIHDPKVV